MYLINRDNSKIALRNLGIPILLRSIGILKMRSAIPEINNINHIYYISYTERSEERKKRFCIFNLYFTFLYWKTLRTQVNQKTNYQVHVLFQTKYNIKFYQL